MIYHYYVKLYLIEIPHQTTTIGLWRCIGICVVSYRNSTSNHNACSRILHSTLVVSYRNSTSNHNIRRSIRCNGSVVSYRNSTSNHNSPGIPSLLILVVSYRNSTSNHNLFSHSIKVFLLYLIEIPHQTTTPPRAWACLLRCILSKFHIKPQLRGAKELANMVVSYRNSTSNHNSGCAISSATPLYLIEIPHQTTTRYSTL